MNLREGRHKPGCTCSFCAGTHRFGKKKADSAKDKPESADEKDGKKLTAESVVRQLLDENCFCQCPACGHEFDQCEQPESSVGDVPCPQCGETVTQSVRPRAPKSYLSTDDESDYGEDPSRPAQL